MKVLMVVHEMNRGGIETLIMNVFRTIDRSKIMFDFVVHVDKECDYDKEVYDLGGTIYHCPDYRGVNHIQYVNWWKSFLKEHPEYRIIHSHSFTLAKIHLGVAKKLGRITIVHSHTSSKDSGLKGIAKGLLTKNVNKVCDYKFACSDTAAEYLFKDKASEAVIIKNGIIAHNFTYNEAVRKEFRNNLNIEDGEIVIGNVASVNNLKNQGFIIEIVKALKDMGKKARFICVGKNYVGDEFVNHAKELGIADLVNFVGLQPNVNEWLQAFDVYIMPSLYEGLPLAAVEAQAAGLRCILSDTISKETDVTGLITFNSLNDSAEKWAETVLDLLPYERNNTYDIISEQGFDIKTTTDWLTEFYSKCSEE